jgi:hypothetical protein
VSLKLRQIRSSRSASEVPLNSKDTPKSERLDTGLNVQHSFDHGDEDAPATEYKALICPACTRVHFINLRTRKVFGQDKSEA